jgi:hypothetical protein
MTLPVRFATSVSSALCCWITSLTLPAGLLSWPAPGPEPSVNIHDSCGTAPLTSCCSPLATALVLMLRLFLAPAEPAAEVPRPPLLHVMAPVLSFTTSCPSFCSAQL